MSVRKITFVFSILCIPYVVCAAESPVANRWDVKSHKEGITPIQRRAYQQLAKLHNFEGWQLDTWGTMLYDEFGVSTPNPMTVLRDMDIDALPILAEALDDETPTKTVTELGTNIAHKPGWKPKLYVWKVNELVARLIWDITDGEFSVGGISHWDLDLDSRQYRIPEVKKETLKWYERNKHKTRDERKIEKLDGDWQSRQKAEFLLGQWKSVKAVPFLVKRIETILAGENQSESDKRELASICFALGKIGDIKGLPTVRKGCDYLSRTLSKSPRSDALYDLFAAYHGLAMLGHKKEVLAELKQIYEKRGSEMTPYRKEHYKAELNEAAKWEERVRGKGDRDETKSGTGPVLTK